MFKLIALAQTWIRTFVTPRISNERGATAVEYGLMVSLIAVAIIATVTLLGGSLDDLFSEVEGKIDVDADS